jgi:heme/copper-type cytochrome/quinol oxidase subunit 2
MRRPGRARLALAVLPVAAALVLFGCGSSGSPGSSGGTAAPSAVQVITVSYAGGVITPPEGRVVVKLGNKVEIRVTSDVSEIVHNHFNNVEQDVAPGGTVVFDFTASKPGIYEVELHKSDKLLLELQVQ